MNVVLLLWRTRLRESWRSAVVLVALIGLGCSVTLAVAAGARRTASSNDAILRATNASDVATFVLPVEDPDRMMDALRSMPEVSDAELWIGFRGRPQGIDPASIWAFYGFWSDQPSVDRPTVTAGRLPAAANEAFLNEAAAARSGLRVGSRLQVALADLSFSDFAPVELAIVGVGLFPEEVIEDELGASSGLWFSRALTQEHLDRHHYVSGRLELGRADTEAVAAGLARLPDGPAVIDERRVDDRDRVQEALRPLSWALASLAALAGAVTALVSAQAFGRMLRRRRFEDQSLAAMGCTTRQLLAADLAFTGAVVACGILAGIALAVAASPLFPVGPPRRVEAVRGIDVDLVALGGGAMFLSAAILTMVAAGSWRRRATRAAAAPGRAPGPLGARPAPSAGLRMLTGRRGTASTAVGISIGLAAVVAILTFTGSLGRLIHEPALTGMDWDVIAREGYTSVDIQQVRAIAEADPSVERISGIGYVDGRLNGVKVPMAGVRPVLGDAWPPVSAGRAPSSTSEILVGEKSLEALRLRIGDEVKVSLSRVSQDETAPPSGSRTFTVVGSSVNPALGLGGSATPRLGSGALMSQEAYEEIFGVPMSSDIVLFDLADRASASSLIARFPDGLPDQLGIPTEWFTSAVPAEVSQAEAARTVIWLAAAALALAVVATIAHTLLGFVRHRRGDYAVLRALGFTRGQIRTTVLIQSGAILGVALVAALPLGAAAGRWLWTAFASRIGVIVEPVVPLLLLSACLLLCVLAVQGVALIPASLARRAGAGRILHGE